MSPNNQMNGSNQQRNQQSSYPYQKQGQQSSAQNAAYQKQMQELYQKMTPQQQQAFLKFTPQQQAAYLKQVQQQNAQKQQTAPKQPPQQTAAKPAAPSASQQADYQKQMQELYKKMTPQQQAAFLKMTPQQQAAYLKQVQQSQQAAQKQQQSQQTAAQNQQQAAFKKMTPQQQAAYVKQVQQASVQNQQPQPQQPQQVSAQNQQQKPAVSGGSDKLSAQQLLALPEVLRLDKVSFYYESDTYVFRDISFNFKKGAVYAIVGKSGAGKTTMLSLLAGLDKAKEGTIYVNGRDIAAISKYQYRSSAVGVVFQSYNLLPKYTAIENVILSMDISGKKYANKTETARNLLASVGLKEDEMNRRVLKLSGGQQQRVAIARSISFDPDIILADEPTGNLDPDTQDEIMRIFLRLAHQQNKCVIIVTHSEVVASMADQVYQLGEKKPKSDMLNKVKNDG